MNGMSGRSLLLLAIAALILTSPVSIQAWQLNDLVLKRTPVPSTWRLVSPEASADFDYDGITETLTLTAGHVTIHTGSQPRWQSPKTWRVEQARISDLNGDGLPEATLLVWRPFQPWPVDVWLPNGGRISSFHDSAGMSCHIILIGWKQDSFRELWAGSAMANPVYSFMAVDLMGNGRNYLVTLEGEYDDPPSAPSRRLKVWEWNGFGFSIVSELEESFSFMGTAQTDDGQVLILAH